jgi:glyoxylase-like metal-dependent hydrolase (beta-lactamase superfamily II)
MSEQETPEDTRIPIITGVPRALSPLVRRIAAPNSGIMTGPGTNTYLVGIDEIAVIDPGPADDEHLDAVAGCGGDRIRWILLTHTHEDHSPGTEGLRERTGAEVLAFDDRDGVTIDRALADGDQVTATEFRLTAVHTPGHASNHLCFFLEEESLLFSGDHIMEGSTVVIRPPDGDMAVYLDSLAKVRKLRIRGIAPGHGYKIEAPRDAIDDYLEHRADREAQILEVLTAAGTATVDDLVATVYVDVDEERHPIARHTTFAHLRKLADEGSVSGDDDIDGEWRPA